MKAKQLEAKDLQQDQLDAVETILDFINTPEATELLIEGPAGSGKTSSIRVATQEMGDETRQRTVVCAPTNKAVKVAREMSGDEIQTTTIYKLLSISLQANGEIKELVQSDNAHQRLMATDLVILDEASMNPKGLRPYIQRAIHDYGIKFVYIGDRYQLPPVNEEISWVFSSVRNRVELTKVKRHDNAILNLATHLRSVIDAGGNGLKIKDDFTEEAGGVELFSKGRQFDERILECWERQRDAVMDGGPADFSSQRILSWRNDRVSGYNDLVREMLYGRAEARANALMVGERVVVCNPVRSLQEQTETLMHTDEEGIIERINLSAHPNYPEIECFKLVVYREATEDVCGMYTPTPAGWRVAERMLKNFSQKAQREDRVFWGAFWTLKDQMNDVRPCHALTTHRSQGSTFVETFVDLEDILCNPSKIEGLKAAYVATTRASHKANIRWSGR